MTMPSDLHLMPMLAALVYAVIGLVVFGLAFVAVDRLTPYTLWKELIDEHNTALAIVVGAIAIAIAIIVSSAIR
jgi:uncharacterized membrane protein YjfL (UPF0719 family)